VASNKEEYKEKMGKYIFLQYHQFAKMCQTFSGNGAATKMNEVKGKGKGHPCTGTEDLYRPYGP
jgi:hypothetical protein